MKFKHLAIGVALIILVGTALFFLYQNNQSGISPQSISEQIIPRLSQAQYEKEQQKIGQLLQDDGIAKTFSYITGQVDTNPSFARDCHPLLHYLGHESYHLKEDNFEAAMENAIEVCNSGYIHGVIQSYFEHNPDQLVLPNNACVADDNWSFRKWQCFHGMGHGFMLANLRDVEAATISCETLGGLEVIESCVNGAYMEMFFLTNHSNETIRILSDVHISTCKDARAYKPHCYLYAPTAFLEENQDAYLKASESYCKQAEQEYVGTCDYGVGIQIMKDSIAKPEIAIEICGSMQESSKLNCVKGAAASYFFNTGTTNDYKANCQLFFGSYVEICSVIGLEYKETLSF